MDLHELKEASVQTALKKMQDIGHFNVCTIDNCADTLGIAIPREVDSIFRNYHCVNFVDIPKKELYTLLSLMAEVFEQEPIDIAEIVFGKRKKNLELSAEPKNGLLRLLSGKS